MINLERGKHVYSNRKAAVLSTLAGVVILIASYYLGLIMIGVIFFPMIWGLTYRTLAKVIRTF
ncbi:hypothetical protein D3P09_10645 [Paenibacillus pinisoli]|uniref:Uncharacterized protein n=1 Tax=Paenibacillus pinisoli TaxID=1276110 RepID=A0A3A6Q1H7_9BACL|nr:hypothetical protein D3P09_10645 [Paenibacillus pinisoli]